MIFTLKSIKDSISSFIKSHSISGTKATWLLFGLFAAVIFVKIVAFQLFICKGLIISSLWKAPNVFFEFWIPKITISLFIALFVFLLRKKYWTYILLFIFDIWIIANVIYFRANNYILTFDAILMASNLDGFSSSIFFYWNWHCSFFLVETIFYLFLSLFLRNQDTRKIHILYVLITIIFMQAIYSILWYKGMDRLLSLDNKEPTLVELIPFNISSDAYQNVYIHNRMRYIEDHSIISYIPGIVIMYMRSEMQKENYVISKGDIENIKPYLQKLTNVKPKRNVIFLLIESLEAYAIESKDYNGNFYLKNLNALSHGFNTLYADKVKSQVKHGVSIDGQMICNTGLLPISNGAAAMKYGRNIYPNYASLYDIAKLHNPFYATTWNQHIVTYSWGYKEMLGSAASMSDNEVISLTSNELQDIGSDSLFCSLTMTIDSHSPFDRIPKNSSLYFDVDMPEIMQKYLNCLHYTDSCFGVWHNEWKLTEQAKNTVLVITGDHTIFKGDMLSELMPYANKSDLSIKNGKTFCPLIIVSPDIKDNILIEDECYQMDIYPTILYLIGAEDYYWKGFGVNLLDTVARHNRPITEEKAYELSDKIIRSNYFKAYLEE